MRTGTMTKKMEMMKITRVTMENRVIIVEGTIASIQGLEWLLYMFVSHYGCTTRTMGALWVSLYC